ncbi:uncharacterized protein CMU_011610 [Cryptosporidium muris RN66]|uniref:Uncharacterized protein n=1 Tax=Cryptosporidium muris (strain RN66) TaxID=441375 RepID=B6AJ20_CRYMR|nr:uncharacterized protein CMU_011610 [Cryptosporidium muris RN66]EEA08211.1 hypothetical protein CMU_011610 [Cryptosporidium muris RN66]|eukprot:XP_002142560.1 hypothetical protein [Cryptosporidium muris RN66]
MHPSNRRKPGRRYILDIEASPYLEARIRNILTDERKNLRRYVQKSVYFQESSTERFSNNEQYKLEEISELDKMIHKLEEIQNHLLRLLVSKNKLYTELIKLKDIQTKELNEIETTNKLQECELLQPNNIFKNKINDIITQIISLRNQADNVNNSKEDHISIL